MEMKSGRRAGGSLAPARVTPRRLRNPTQALAPSRNGHLGGASASHPVGRKSRTAERRYSGKMVTHRRHLAIAVPNSTLAPSSAGRPLTTAKNPSAARVSLQSACPVSNAADGEERFTGPLR